MKSIFLSNNTKQHNNGNTKLAKVVITANAATAKKVLEEIDNLVKQYTADIQRMTAAGQANTAECKQAERTLKALSQVQRDNIEDTKRLSAVVQDLTNTKLRDLRRALGSANRLSHPLLARMPICRRQRK